MQNNPILDEIYAARDKLLADAGGDVHRYLEGVREREQASGRLMPPNKQRTLQGLDSAEKVKRDLRQGSE